MKRYIVLHHSTTADGRLNDWKAICKFHTSYRRTDTYELVNSKEEAERLSAKGVPIIGPWAPPCGYHRGIEREDGRLVEHLGRNLEATGAHASGFNATGVGVCVVGNFDQHEPDQELWLYTLATVRKLARDIGQDITAMVMEKRVLGHWETYQLLNRPIEKTCPGRWWDMDKFRRDLLTMGE